jgi:hypothetical protein
MRTYTTISNQTIYDVTVQKFGSLDDMDKVIRQVGDMNSVLPFGMAMSLDNTEDVVARKFDFDGSKFSTGAELLDTPEDTPGAYSIAYSIAYD